MDMVQLNTAAAHYFHDLLLHTAAPRHYVTQRGLTPETVATFQLGYAPPQRDALKRHFMGQGYREADLMAVGLLGQPDDGSPSYDRFRHRLMIPIRNPQGQVIGFGARALAETQQPKYLNSPQTALFSKSATLFGLDVAQIETEVVMVEGYLDVIQAHQRGARNVVAQMGTAFTEGQLKQLSAPKIIFALDPDAAGQAATLRSLTLARQWLPKELQPVMTAQGIELRAYNRQSLYVATLPPGQDPDDVLKQGLAAWQQLIDHALPMVDFYEQFMFRHLNARTPNGKSQLVHALMPIYREVESQDEKISRVQRLARKLDLPERLLINQLEEFFNVEATTRNNPRTT